MTVTSHFAGTHVILVSLAEKLSSIRQDQLLYDLLNMYLHFSTFLLFIILIVIVCNTAHSACNSRD